MSEPSTAAAAGSAALRTVARGVGRWAVRVTVVLVGAWLGILLLGRVSAPIGPFDATVALRPFGGGAALDIPPLGALQVDAYDGPLRLEIQLSRVDEVRATALANDPTRLDRVVDEVSADLRDAVERVAWLTALASVGGATATSLVLLRRRREVLIALGLSTALVAATGGIAAATWRPAALSQPTYTGLLVNANSLIGSAQDIVARFDAYRASLEDLVSNVSSLYSTLSTLPPPGGADDSVALLHVSDIHLNPAGFDLVQQVVTQFDVDGVLDTGDIERVHAMRVASRRLRAVLEIFSVCFPKEQYVDVLSDVKRIADALGMRRDPDVHIAGMERFAAELDEAQRPGIELLIADLREEQATGNEALAVELERKLATELDRRLRALADDAEVPA